LEKPGAEGKDNIKVDVRKMGVALRTMNIGGLT
jgi:hypothetical protein